MTGDTCTSLEKKVKPIGFKLGDKIFEVPASGYLFQAEGKCQFGIYKNDLGGDSVSLFILGEPLLKHLYMVYDFENEEIKLGVNLASEGKVLIYKEGERPEPEKELTIEEAAKIAAGDEIEKK